MKHCPFPDHRYKTADIEGCEPHVPAPGPTPKNDTISMLALNFILLMIMIAYIIWDNNRNITYILYYKYKYKYKYKTIIIINNNNKINFIFTNKKYIFVFKLFIKYIIINQIYKFCIFEWYNLHYKNIKLISPININIYFILKSTIVFLKSYVGK